MRDLIKSQASEEQYESPACPISVIIPTRNERYELGNTIHSIGMDPAVEIIVADGGSRDGTQELAAQVADRVVNATAGRASQLNAGARHASGEILVFLHADTSLPAGALRAIRTCLTDPRNAGGAFRMNVDSGRGSLRLISWGINMRSRWFGLPYGDQAIFVRRSWFEELRGFRSLDIMEDVDFVRRLRRKGRVALLDLEVRTSERRWQINGVCRTTLVNWAAISMYALAIKPEKIRHFYDAHLRSRNATTSEDKQP
jgi:rSAM/selenodomain-associated transferase 2